MGLWPSCTNSPSERLYLGPTWNAQQFAFTVSSRACDLKQVQQYRNKTSAGHRTEAAVVAPSLGGTARYRRHRTLLRRSLRHDPRPELPAASIQARGFSAEHQLPATCATPTRVMLCCGCASSSSLLKRRIALGKSMRDALLTNGIGYGSACARLKQEHRISEVVHDDLGSAAFAA